MTKAILEVFPKRPEPSPFPAVLRAVREALKSGASAEQLVQAAQEYATFVERHVPDRTFVRSPVRFYSYGYWREYQPIPRIYGRTREEWARSGQDVAEFDRLIASLAPALLSTVATQER